MLLRVDACPLGSMRALLRALVQVDSPKREQGDKQTQRLRRDDKFIMVAWMNLASRSNDEMNPTAHSADTADYWNLNHMKRMSPEDPKTINHPCSISFIYAEQREAQEAEPDEAAINTRGAQNLTITPDGPPETRNNHDEDEARDLDFDPQDNVDAQRAEVEGRSMTRDEGEASENTFGPYVEKQGSKTRNTR